MRVIIEDQGTVKKSTYDRFFWSIVRAIALIVATWAFITFLLEDLYGGEKSFTALVVLVIFFTASLGGESRRAIRFVEGEPTTKAAPYGLWEWSFLVYGGLVSLGFNWKCVFLWFSRRYDPLSAPVVGGTVLLMASYAVVAIVAVCVTTKNWRSVVVVCTTAPGALAAIVLRFGLLR